jgi:hypothetical protein
MLRHLRRTLGSREVESFSFDADERRAAKAGTLRSRQEYVEARRREARERDAERYRLAEEFAAGLSHRIPPEEGFAVFPPGEIEPAVAVVAAANERYATLSEEDIASHLNKALFYASGLLPPDALALGTPYLDFALSEEVVGPIAAYFGMIPVLYEIDMWYSVHTDLSLKGSQQWHIDPTDATAMKVWVHCSDVGCDSGPLTALSAAESEEIADRIGYAFDKDHYRAPDEEFAALKPRLVELTGPTGSVSFIDTCRCFHMGSRVDAGAEPRRMINLTYSTPYAFNFGDHRVDAPYRELASGSSSDLERLVLGAT